MHGNIVFFFFSLRAMFWLFLCYMHSICMRHCPFRSIASFLVIAFIQFGNTV